MKVTSGRGRDGAEETFERQKGLGTGVHLLGYGTG